MTIIYARIYGNFYGKSLKIFFKNLCCEKWGGISYNKSKLIGAGLTIFYFNKYIYF